MHAGAGPAHVRAIDDTGVDRRKACGAANMLGSGLIERDVLERKPGGFLLLDAVQKSLHRPVTAVKPMVEMRKHRQVIAMFLKRLERGGGHIILAGRFWEKVSRIKAKMIADAHEPFGTRSLSHCGAFEPRQGQCHTQPGKKLASINLHHANTSLTTCPCTLVSRRSRPL